MMANEQFKNDWWHTHHHYFVNTYDLAEVIDEKVKEKFSLIYFFHCTQIPGKYRSTYIILYKQWISDICVWYFFAASTSNYGLFSKWYHLVSLNATTITCSFIGFEHDHINIYVMALSPDSYRNEGPLQREVFLKVKEWITGSNFGSKSCVCDGDPCNSSLRGMHSFYSNYIHIWLIDLRLQRLSLTTN